MKKRYLFIIVFILAGLGGGYFLAMLDDSRTRWTGAPSDFQTGNAPQAGNDLQTVPMDPGGKIFSETATDKPVEFDVPFVIQAPTGNWDDPVFQNACEEASIIMAMGWVDGVESISPSEAQRRISEMYDFEMRNFGYGFDTDVFDVKRIFEQYLRHSNVSVREDIGVADIKKELQGGKLVIVPAFGQMLANPYYTPPGPVAHMLVITGYDPDDREFITNDPGTKRGGGYRYDEDVLLRSVWQYPSGQDVPPAPEGNLKKAMVVVGK